MTPLRVLCVIPSLTRGGAERSLVELVPGFVAAGLEMSIASFAPRSEIHDELERLGVQLHQIPGSRLPTRTSALRRIIRATRPDVVHTSLYDADLAGRVAAWHAAPSPRVLTSLVNTTYEPVRLADPNVRPSVLRGVQMVDAWTSRHLTSHFHAVSHAVKDSAVRGLRIPPGRITVVERGRDPGRLGEPSAERRSHARARLGLGADALVVLNVGRQDFQKDQLTLVEAFDAVGTARPEAELLIVGPPGAQSAAIERRIGSSPVGDRIHLLGARDDVPELLAAADVFALPSLYEGIAGAVIEAMALRLPVVSSDLPGLREVVEDGLSATLVPPRDPARFAAELLHLLDNEPRRRRFGQRGREIFLERFTLGRSLARMIELYRTVAAR